MSHLKFDVGKLEKLNDPGRFTTLDPDVIWPAVAFEAPATIVDLGAGTGLFAEAFAAREPGAVVFAVDSEPAMTAWMREHRAGSADGRLAVVDSTETSVPLPGACADVVTMINLHHELADALATYTEALRLLRPGGRVLVVDWAPTDTPKGPPLAVRATADTLRHHLEAAGFTDVDVRSGALPWHTLVTASRPGRPATLLRGAGAPLARIHRGSAPLVAFAVHAGSAVRPSLDPYLGLSAAERRREEDPFTALMAPPGATLVEVLRSRFEVDLNRPRFRAVYQDAADAWGLPVWSRELPDAEDRVSRAVYDHFYEEALALLAPFDGPLGPAVVLDLHSYNHRRDGAGSPAADSAGNPDINLGTRRIDRTHWAPVVDAFLASLLAEGIDARENVKFGGGHLCHAVADRFPRRCCPLAIEFKKTYMDEWTGQPDTQRICELRDAVDRASAAAVEALEKLGEPDVDSS